MPRQPRIQVPNLVRHVMARGNARMPIFLDDADFVRFLRILGDVLESSQITCWNYCLMPNHYHATLQPSQANLSQALRRVNSEYALWWNRRQGRVGHVFQGRFKDQVVDQDQYLLALSRYVVMNPVRANLVQKPEDWRWSSYRATVGLSSAPSFLNNSTTLRLFGDGSESELRASFARWVSANVDDWTAVDRIRSNERILGSQDFKGLVSSCSTRDSRRAMGATAVAAASRSHGDNGGAVSFEPRSGP